VGGSDRTPASAVASVVVSCAFEHSFGLPGVVTQVSATSAVPAMRVAIGFAGFWRRLLAHLIDTTLLFGVDFSILTAVTVLAPGDREALLNAVPVCAALGWAYYAVLESSPARGTLGKLALGLYVADAQGDPIGFWRAVLRNALKGLSSVLLGTGWLMAAFTPRKQALHDLLAGTLVLRKTNYFVIGPEVPTEPGEHWNGTQWVASLPPMERWS
jgi:uncharacterized RDD family membrane protein YckC